MGWIYRNGLQIAQPGPHSSDKRLGNCWVDAASWSLSRSGSNVRAIFYILNCSASQDWLPSQDGDLFSVLNIIYQDSKILEFPCLKLFFQWAWQKKLSWFNNIKLHMIILCFPLYITLSMWINAKKTWLLNITMDYIDVCLCLPSSVWFLK